MSETSTTPIVSQYLLAAYWAYYQSGVSNTVTPPAGLSTFNVNGTALYDYDAATGFYGAALVTQTGQIIITFEGTNFFTGSAAFTAGQIADDTAISLGINAPSYYTALAFTDTVTQDAEADGYSASDIFLSGHSLGGANAEYVATQTGLSGDTFGAPGIPSFDIPTTTPSVLLNEVELGDPIGNYAVGGKDAWELSPFIVHFGTTSYIGSPLGTVLLNVANAAFYAIFLAQTDTQREAAVGAWLGSFGAAAAIYHALGTYAADLDVTLPGGDVSASGLGISNGTISSAITDALTGYFVNANGSIDVPTFNISAAGAVSVSGSDLTFTADGQSTTLSLPETSTGLSLQSDGSGGTLITLGTTSDGYVLGGSDGATIQGDTAPLTFVGGTGSVSVLGGSGAVTLYGATSSTATSFLEGGSGSNLLYGGAGATTLVAGTGASTLVGGSGPSLMLANGTDPNEIVAGSGATTVNGTYGTGPDQVFAGSGSDIIALGSGADSVIAGSGVASVIGGTGPDVYGFVDGHAGGREIILGLKAADTLVFGGYGGDPITSEGVVQGSDLITLSDGTVILLAGIDHKIFS